MPNANEYMLKQADAEAIYQKKLNAGTGINIDPITDTISATGSGGSTVTYTPNITAGTILGVLGINGNSNPIKSPSLIAGQNVVITQDPTTGALTFSSANTTYNDMIGADGADPGTHGLAPAPAATDNTKFLKGDGTWGDPVTPNPSAAATATLSKLSINNTVYDLAGGTTTYLGTTDPSNSVGNNGDLYFKYTSTPTTVEKEITLPTIPYGQNTYIEIADFSSYTDFTFTYTDVYSASLEKTVSISDIPESNDPLNGSRYEIYTFNSWFYLFVGKDSNGLWVVRGENCSFTKLVGTYAGAQIDITKAYVKIDDEWIEQSSGSGTEVIANPSGTATNTLNKIEIDGTIYGINGGGGGGSFIGLTKSEYDALPTSEKEDTSKLYLVQEGGGGTLTTPVDMSGGTPRREGSMNFNTTSTSVQSVWNGGSSIGGQYTLKAIDLTDIDELSWELVSTTCYDHKNSNVEEQTNANWHICVGLSQSLPTSWANASTFSLYAEYKYTNTTYSSSECKLDVSSLTGVYYITLVSHGWNLVFSNLKAKQLDKAEITRHTYWNNAKWSQWNQVKELSQVDYNALTTAEKQDGSIYMTHDDGYKFISYNNDQIVVRVNTNTGETLWFFNGWVKSTTADVDIPAELISYLPDHTTSTQVIQAKAWTDSTSTTTNGWVGFVYPGTSSVKLRAWSTNFSSLISGTFWAVLDINGSSAEGGQTLPYSAPTEGLTLLPNRIYYNDTMYAEKVQSGSSGVVYTNLYTASNETAPNTITLNDDITNYDMIVINISPATASISTLAMTSSNYIVDALVSGCIIGAFAGSNHAWYNYTNSTTLTKYATAGNYYIKSIVGIKY